MKQLVTTALLLLLFVAAAQAQDQKRVALVIGNANYAGGSALKNPVNDANLMEQTLKNLNFEVIKKINATKTTIELALYEFASKAERSDVMLLYYAGHGIQIGSDPYLVPIGADPENELAVKFHCINVKSMLEDLEFYPENLNIVILDACRNNPFRTWKRSGNTGFTAPPQPNGTIIAYATDEGMTADDNPNANNGLYTLKLVEQLKQPQKIIDVFRNTRFAVMQATSDQQQPMFWDKTNGDFFLKYPTAENPNFVSGVDVIQYGQISIDTEIGGSLYLDDRFLGSLKANTNNNLLQTITTGTHTLKITGNENWQQSVNVIKDQTVKISAKTTKTTSNITENSTNTKDIPALRDSRDGKVYKIVSIGTQVWMAENLAYKPTSGNYWAYDNDQSNVEKYGYLYDWETAKTVCPSGWHLPSDDEWEVLAKYISSEAGPFTKDDDDWKDMGKLLKSKSGWDSNGNGVDKFGFSALPGGRRGDDGSFYYEGDYGIWWSSATKSSSNAWSRYLNFNNDTFNRDSGTKEWGFSVRCLGN